ncbi:nonribosomal peptide synthetase [Ascosphaera apis ARSEF 7405]|uniref:Nonribosomal peptide synthetase n=1 Tax=Ascosphaera apis ARSEF 7405 TaxID=392613 RepID=A0A168DMY1_9EURO|nr:nonribosomal peptide synthetase [Ascosphaera apis ARSEF 7405]
MDTPPCRYTRLPKLQFGEEIPESASVDFALQDPSCSDKDVVSAWCSLLSALTGDETPVFYLNENAVRFNPATGAVENVELVHEECDDTRLYAALSIRGAKTKHCDEFGLSLRYDVLNQTGTLAARGFSTTAYLQEIDSQLRSFLRQQSKPCQLSVQNAKPSFISGPTLLHELFTSHCDSHHTALDFLQKGGSRTELSYNQLHRLSNNLALKINSTLEQHGSDGRSRIIIPVMLPQSPEFYISWLAVLKSGAAICPLNLDTPPERIKFILNDVCATAVITAPHLADRIREARNDVAIIFAPDQNEELNHLLDTLENSRIHTSDPAYIMYTSGSTGLPKGVVLSHQAATQALLAHDRHIPPFSRFLQFASPTFDVSVFEIFFPWFRGATLVGCERGKMLSNLPEIMNIMQVDAAEFTPTVANELVRSRSNVPSLKVMLTIGEMLTRHVIDEFGASHEREGLLCGMYGPTEAAIHCTVAERIHVGDLVGNIGVPLDTVSIFIVPIVDRNARNQGFNISPLGHIGELALGGYQLADGYLNREKENKTAFIDLPGYGRVYRTGDKARIHPNGLLECLGRITTDQVKLRGQRIELGEIEQIICKAEGVRNAVVNVVEGILVAFVTLDGRSVSSADISATCKRWLPRYMIPGDFVILDELPRLPSAKIDRKLLVAEYQNNRKPAKAEFSDRSDKLTRDLVLHVEEILGVPVGVDESLASKGLDSLGAIKLASRLRGEGLIFDVTDILDADCIRNLSLRVQLKENVAQQSNLISQDEDFRQVKAVVVEELNKIGVSPHVHDIYPCSPIQIAMLTETVRDHQAYFNLIEHEFEAGVQEDEVRNAIMMVAQQNEILRTGFLSTENPAYSFVQIIWDDLKEEQFSGLHTYNDDLQSRMLRPLSFELMHIDAKIRMRCQIHHSLYDGWSWELVCNDINRVLTGKKLPRRPQYRAVVDTINHGIQSETWERATDYWRDQLRGYQGRRWPNFNYKSSAAPGRQTLHRTMKIQAPEAKVFARNLHVSIQAIFQSVLAHLLASYLGSDDVVIGSVSSGRTLGVPGVEKIIGPCVATVPLRFRTKTMRTLRDLLITANTLNRQNLRHEFVSLQQIQKLNSKLLQSCSQAFDVAIFEIFFTLNKGMTLCATTNDLLFRDIEHFIQRMGVTHLSMTSTVAALVQPENVPKVRFLVSAGESLNSKVLAKWGGKGLWQGYGPTETTNIVTLKENIGSDDRPNDIGTPLDTTSVFIVAEGADFSLVPRGGIGELCFGGDQVAQGYANMKALTQEKFITHPEFGRIYRSGDFGRMLPNSSILFLGRKDDQVKFRGQRIELGEIDACLSQQPEISDSMTMIQLCQEENQQRLVSFLVLSDRLKQNTLQQYQIVRNLFNALETSLPPYMIPSAMIPVDSFPLNASGKKDPGPLLEQLKNFDHETFGKFSHGASISEDAEDLSEAEGVIASCISQVTNIPLRNIRKHSSFFALGLDSISATSLSKSLRSRGLGQVDVSKILTYSSVFRLAAYISEHRQSFNSNAISTQESSLLPSDLVNQVWQQTKLRGYEPTNIFPCTPLQETMLAQLSDGDSYHNILTLEPICDLEVLKRSWEKAIERHDILRTRFASTYDTRYPFVQIVLRKIELSWTVVSESGNVEGNLNGMHALKADDLVPYKFTVHRSGPQPLLKIDIHHSIYDAAAMSIILHDVEAITQGHTRPPTLPFEGFLRYMVASQTTECYSFWQNYLNGVRCMRLVSGTPSTTPRHFRTVRGIAPMSLGDLTGQCMEMSTTLLSVVQAAWAKVLGHFSNTQELCFGNVYSGRNIPVDGADLIVGPCFNTLPIRVTLSPESINLNIVHDLRDDNLRILPYQLTPLRKLRTQLRRDNGVLFDTLLLLQDDRWRLDDTIWKLKDEHGAMDLPLICEVIPDKETGVVETVLHFDGSLISEADADSILSAFRALLSHTVSYPYSQALDTTFLDNLVLQSVKFEVQKAETTNESYMHEPSAAGWDAHAAKIRDILCELSDTQRADITLNTTIYQLGLDSINALQLARKLADLGYEISAGDILEKPSVYEIAEHVVSTHNKFKEEPGTFNFSAFSASQKGVLRKNPYAAQHLIKSVLPCTPVQAGMLASFINSDGASYFNHLLLRLDSFIDMAMVRNAWELLIERHEMLRTGFFQTDSRDAPFAMVTYATGALTSHWKSFDCLPCSSQKVSLLRKRMCEEALENLARPPWFISLQDDESGVLMQFSAHHALYDAQSLSLIFSDFSKLLRGNALVGPRPIWPMHEIIINEAHTCSTVAREYWQSMQSKFLVTKFPDVNPFHPNQPYHTSSLAFESQQSLPRLQELCNNANVSLQGACQAAWARLLSAYVGEKTVTCGIVLSGRSLHAEAENITFPCLVTLPACYQVEGTNRQMLSRVMAQNSQLTRYQFTPLSKIYEWTKFDSSLFNTLFVFQKFQQDTRADLPWVILDEKAEVDYPISLEISPSRTALHYNLSFRSDLLPQAQAELMLRQLDQLLLHCLSSLEDDVNDISVFSPDIISVTPAKEIEIAPPCRLLHQLFEKTASRLPSKVALECITRENSGMKVRQWTYAEVDKESNRYAHLFQQHGASPGGLIAICFDKCPAAYMAILGILKAGCAYVAIDPTAPVARKRFILEDSRAQMLLGISDTAKDLKLFATSDVIIVDEPGILQNISDSSPSLASAISPDNASYCLYTSGTTGTPKGCQITHNNAVQAMLAFQRLFNGHWDDTSRWLQFASFHFDVSVLEQYWTWSVGICLVSCPRDLLFEDLPGTLAKLEITHIDLTPSLARLVHPDEVPSLKKGVFITGGEALRQDILDDWGRFNVIYNGYGPTEVTIGCTMFPRVPENGKPANIGPQFDNVSSYVFRPGTTTPVLRGGIGELCVGGPLVGKGYLNRDDLTKERFICLDKYEDRIYRTGDLVRLYHDGTFCFLGRQDDQIKLRGQRLEIGEINETITQSAKEIRGVATIIAKRSEKTRDQLVSFLVISEPVNSHAVQVDLSPRAQEIASIARQACLAALPGFIVLVSDLLGLDATTVSPGSNLFQLGLDSITVTVFTKDLRNNGFRSVSSADVMKNPTIASLYKVISETDRQEKSNRSLLREAKLQLTAFSQANFLAVTRYLNVNSTDLQRIGPCTPLQEGILYQYLESQGKSYLANFCFEVSRNVSISRLQQSWTRAQESIPALRTRFVSTDNGFVQAIMKEDILPCSKAKVSHNETPVELIQRHFHRWVDERNHLSSPWEVLFVEDADKTMMVINIFHAIYDGISLPFILREVAKIYMGPDYTPDKPSLLDALPWVFALDAPAAREFWIRHIRERKARLLASSDLGNAGQPLVVTHELKEIDNIETLRRKLNVTEQAIFLACWVYITTQHFHFCPKLGLVVSGRAIDFDRAQDVIGPMFNTIPCAVSPAGCASMRDLVKLCHDYYASIIPYQHTPLRDIRKWLKEPADSPLFDSLFVFQKDSHEETSTEELWHAVSSDSDQDFSLSFEVQRQGDGQVTLTLATKDGIMSRDDAKNLCTLFDDTLHAFMQDLDMPLNIELPDEKQTTETDEPHDLSQPSGQAESFEWTPLALQLREQIAQLAETDASSIQANTSIFEFGLDSIDAIRLSSRMKSSGVKLPVTAIMKGRTIANLVKSVSSQVVEDNCPEFSINDLKNQLAQSLAVEVSGLHDVEDVLPATPLQEAMVAEMASSDFHRYFNHDVMELASWVDLDRLKCAWQDVIHKNPILRTRFVEVSDPDLPFSYAQVVCSGDDQVWETREIDEGGIDDYLLDPTHWYKPADVLNSELVHLQLVTATDRRYLVFSASHALYDGWSLNLIHQDVKSAYYNSAPKRPACEAALEQVINSSGETAAEFWKGALVGYTPVKFPKQVHAGGQNTVHRGEKIISISATQMSSFCKNERISPQALGLACWSLVYAGYIQKLDVVFGTVMLGRDSEDAEQMMFPMFNTVAFRSILHGSRKELLKYTQERLDAVREYQHYPLRKAKAFAQGISGDLALFDTLFIYQRNPDRGVIDEGVEQSLYKSVGGESDLEVPVCAEVEVVGDDIIWRVSARDTVLGDEDVTGLFERIGAVFEEVVNKPMEEVISEVEGGISVCGCPAFREFDEDDGSENDGQTRFLMDLENWKPTALERKIMDALASVAGIPADDISPEQSLFHLGLDSISAIKVSSLLRKQSVFLAVSEMVKAGTVPEMAKVAKEWKALENKRKPHDLPKPSEEQRELLRDYGMNPENIEYVLPATAGQVYMLATHEASNGRLFYPYFVYKLARTAGGEQSSVLEVRKRLNTAWTTLTKRLPILRTVFVPTGKGKDNGYEVESLYLQATLRDVDNPVRWEDEDALKKLANAHGQGAKYNAGEIPVTLHALHPSQGDEEDVGDDVTLILHIHHALYDAVSLPLMMDALADLFFSTKMEGGNETMDPATDLKDFVQYLQEYSPVERRKAFWKEYLDSSIGRENKHLKPRPVAAGAARSGRVEAYRESLLANTSAAIEQARRHGVSVQAIFLACFARVWKRVLFMVDGQDRETIVVGIYLSNRGHALDGLSQMIGPSLNIVPLKVDVSDDEEREVDIARRVQGDLQRVSTVENSCVSLEEVREWTGVRVDVFVNFLRGEGEEGQGQGQGQEGRVRYVPAEALEQAGDDDYDESIGKSEMTYSVGIDIEAAIREKRRLDMGIFAERRKMSDEEAEMVFNEVREQMKMIRE